MEDQIYKHSTTFDDIHYSTYFLTHSQIITPTSLSIFFSNPSADYKYSDIGSGAAGYISSADASKIFDKELKTRPSNSLFQIARSSGATLSECTFPKSAHHSKISRSATRFHSRKHSDDACFYSVKPEGTRQGFQSSTMKCSGLVNAGPTGYPTRKGEDLARLGLSICNSCSIVTCNPTRTLASWTI
jgi:hypothetical protein